MNNRTHLFRLYELALRALDDAMGDEDYLELNEILSENPESLEIYFELMATCSSLYRDLGETISEPCEADSDQLDNIQSLWLALAEEERTAETIQLPEPEEVPHRNYVQVQKIAMPERKVSKFSLFSVIASLAAILMMVAYVQLVPVPAPTVAQLTETHQARWAEAGETITEGVDLAPGYMELLSGYAHITFNSGAAVIVEGPAKLDLESEGVLYLQNGKVSCNVPESAIGFTVGTPAATVVDFGTEFGVLVQDTGRTEAHVFKGEVDLRTGPDALVFDASRRLTAGQASIVDENQALQPRRLQARSHKFIRTELIPYEIAIRRSKPFAYWRFDTSGNTVFQNVLKRNLDPCEYHGNVQIVPGPSLGKGKTSGAVQLDGQGSYVYVPKAGDRNREGENKSRDYSYSFWIRPDVIRAQDLITVTNKGAQQYRHIGLDGVGRFTFFTYYFHTEKRVAEFSGNTIFEPGQWYHVVVTGKQVKGMQSEIHLYVNGLADASKFIRSTYSPAFFGHFNIGSVPEVGKVQGVHSFDGAITEVVEYDRTLTPKEVQEIYSSIQE